MNSCGDCEFFANQYRKDHFNIILQSKPSSGREYVIKGINPITKLKVEYYSKGGLLDVPFKYLVSIGDTLVKKEGELRVFIHKRDTVLVYHFECDGKVYD